MESPSSRLFQSRLHKKLSGLRVPAICLRLRMMLKKIANPLYAVSTERQGKEKTYESSSSLSETAAGGLMLISVAWPP